MLMTAFTTPPQRKGRDREERGVEQVQHLADTADLGDARPHIGESGVHDHVEEIGGTDRILPGGAFWANFATRVMALRLSRPVWLLDPVVLLGYGACSSSQL